MRHQTVDTYVRKLVQRRDKLANVIGTHSEPHHARVDFHVNISDGSRLGGGVIQRFEHVPTINDRSQFVLNTRGRLSRPKTSETRSEENTSELQSHSFISY